MKNNSFVVGAVSFVLGAALFGGGAACAEGVIAERSTSAVYVDGQRVELDAYTIFGSNYVKLRDVGKAVNVNVFWDGNAVQIETGAPYTGEAPAARVTANATKTERSIPLRNVPEVGDRIVCDDGSTYEIKDMYRWDNEPTKPGNLPDLPEPTSDWSKFPVLELPVLRKIRYKDATGDDLFMLNLYETRRMEYTLYNALGSEPGAWKDGEPLATVQFGIPAELEKYADVFWPWHESELIALVHSRPASHYRCEAYDYYHNGIFQHTRYFILSE